MLRILKAKMVEKGIDEHIIAALIGRSPRSVYSRIAEKTVFTFPEAIKIRDAFFPGMSVDVLLASDHQNSA